MPEAKNKEDNQNSDKPQNEDEIRIGVYTCYCGGNISDVVQCEKVAKAVGREEEGRDPDQWPAITVPKRFSPILRAEPQYQQQGDSQGDRGDRQAGKKLYPKPEIGIDRARTPEGM